MSNEHYVTFINGEQCMPTNVVYIAGFIVGDVCIADSIVSVVWTDDGIYSHYYYEEGQPNVDELIDSIGSLNYVA